MQRRSLSAFSIPRPDNGAFFGDSADDAAAAADRETAGNCVCWEAVEVDENDGILLWNHCVQRQ